jgi:hypothetical protein
METADFAMGYRLSNEADADLNCSEVLHLRAGLSATQSRQAWVKGVPEGSMRTRLTQQTFLKQFGVLGFERRTPVYPGFPGLEMGR